MNYHLNIVELIPLTEEEKKAFKEKNNYFGGEFVGDASANNRRPVLDVVITAEEWEKIKLAVLEHKS